MKFLFLLCSAIAAAQIPICTLTIVSVSPPIVSCLPVAPVSPVCTPVDLKLNPPVCLGVYIFWNPLITPLPVPPLPPSNKEMSH